MATLPFHDIQDPNHFAESESKCFLSDKELNLSWELS